MNSSPDDESLNPAERELEGAMGHLAPVQTSLDAQSIWALSIARRNARSVWFWRATSSALAACLVVAIWAKRPTHPSPREHIVYIHDQQPMSTQPSPAPAALVFFPDADRQILRAYSESENYLDVRQNVMRRGLRALTPIHVPVDSRSSRPSAPPDTTSSIDRAIQPPTDGPVNQFFDLLNKGSQL